MILDEPDVRKKPASLPIIILPCCFEPLPALLPIITVSVISLPTCAAPYPITVLYSPKALVPLLTC